MKTEIRYRLFGFAGLLGLLLLCITGCNKDKTQTMLRITRTEYVPEQQQKSYIGLGLQDMIVTWQTTDQVNINGNTYSLSNVNMTQAEASDVPSVNGGFAAVYPSGNSLTLDGGLYTGGSVAISNAQTYSEDANGHQIINAPMAAKLPSTSGVLYFRNVASLLRIAVMNGTETNQSFTVNSITVTSDTTDLYGTQQFTFPANTSSNNVSLGNLSSGGKTVTLRDCSVAGNIAKGGMKVFNIVVAPYTNQKNNLTITVNGKLSDSTSNKDYTIVQNTARNLGIGEVGVQFFATNFEKY